MSDFSHFHAIFKNAVLRLAGLTRTLELYDFGDGIFDTRRVGRSSVFRVFTLLGIERIVCKTGKEFFT